MPPGHDVLNAHQAHGVPHQAAQDFFLELLALIAAHGNEIVILLGVEHALVIQKFRDVADGLVNLRIAGGEAQAFRLPADDAAVGQKGGIGITGLQQVADIPQILFRGKVVLNQGPKLEEKE